MKKNLFRIMFIFLLVFTGLSIYFLNFNSSYNIDIERGTILIDLNEIRKESEIKGITDSTFYDKLDDLETKINNIVIIESNDKYILYLYFIVLLLVFSLFTYIYYAVIKPFKKMEDYAGEIAKGNLDIKLNYDRGNLFGDFTWAFDHMRKEIIKARTCEKEAIENNKTVIATLSHDIKTPIASIRAYAEGLEANLAVDFLKRKKYIDVILKKCDEVTTLTNDIFLHSLADLNKLKMNIEEISIKEFLTETLDTLQCSNKNIIVKGDIYESILLIDGKRVEQAIGNIINNAEKYAANKSIEISTEKSFKEYKIIIRDYGLGILDEDIPFIFEKFYRGKNSNNEQGAGLGLYIVKYIMEQIGGEVLLKSYTNGLEVKLSFPLK